MTLMSLAEKLSDLTRQALSYTDARDWAALELLQNEREKLLLQLRDHISERPVQTEQESLRLAEILNQIKDADQSMSQRIEGLKAGLLDENHDLKKGQRMQKAYKPLG